MLNLPKSTETNKQLPKTAIFDKFAVKPARRESFDADISKIYIANTLSPNTLPSIAPGDSVKKISVMHIHLKRADYDKENIAFLAKSIHQKMLFALQYEDKIRLDVFRNRLVESGWYHIDEAALTLKGTTLDAIWDNIASIVGNFEVDEGNTVEQQVAKNDAKDKLNKKIAQLEAKTRTEKQPRRKLELFEELKKLKTELD